MSLASEKSPASIVTYSSEEESVGMEEREVINFSVDDLSGPFAEMVETTEEALRKVLKGFSFHKEISPPEAYKASDKTKGYPLELIDKISAENTPEGWKVIDVAGGPVEASSLLQSSRVKFEEALNAGRLTYEITFSYEDLLFAMWQRASDYRNIVFETEKSSGVIVKLGGQRYPYLDFCLSKLVEACEKYIKAYEHSSQEVVIPRFLQADLEQIAISPFAVTVGENIDFKKLAYQRARLLRSVNFTFGCFAAGVVAKVRCKYYEGLLKQDRFRDSEDVQGWIDTSKGVCQLQMQEFFVRFQEMLIEFEKMAVEFGGSLSVAGKSLLDSLSSGVEESKEESNRNSSRVLEALSNLKADSDDLKQLVGFLSLDRYAQILGYLLAECIDERSGEFYDLLCKAVLAADAFFKKGQFALWEQGISINNYVQTLFAPAWQFVVKKLKEFYDDDLASDPNFEQFKITLRKMEIHPSVVRFMELCEKLAITYKDEGGNIEADCKDFVALKSFLEETRLLQEKNALLAPVIYSHITDSAGEKADWSIFASRKGELKALEKTVASLQYHHAYFIFKLLMKLAKYWDKKVCEPIFKYNLEGEARDLEESLRLAQGSKEQIYNLVYTLVPDFRVNPDEVRLKREVHRLVAGLRLNPNCELEMGFNVIAWVRLLHEKDNEQLSSDKLKVLADNFVKRLPVDSEQAKEISQSLTQWAQSVHMKRLSGKQLESRIHELMSGLTIDPVYEERIVNLVRKFVRNFSVDLVFEARLARDINELMNVLCKNDGYTKWYEYMSGATTLTKDGKVVLGEDNFIAFIYLIPSVNLRLWLLKSLNALGFVAEEREGSDGTKRIEFNLVTGYFHDIGLLLPHELPLEESEMELLSSSEGALESIPDPKPKPIPEAEVLSLSTAKPKPAIFFWYPDGRVGDEGVDMRPSASHH